MQRELATAINELTNASAINQVARTTVDAIIYIHTALGITSVRQAILDRSAGAIKTSKASLSMLKNSDEFISKTASRVTIKESAKASIQELIQLGGYKYLQSVATKAIRDVANASEARLYLDSFASSGQGTIQKLYEINQALDAEYNSLAQEKAVLMRQE